MKTIIVFKTHVDIGFTDLSENVLKQYTEEMLPAAIDVCEETQTLGEGKKYVWTMPSYMMKRCMDEKYVSREMLDRGRSLAVSGQLAWHALPFTTHTEFCGLEEYVRSFLISRNLSESYGYWPISAKMTDVPGHTRMLPSILAKAGIKFLHLGSNPSTMAPQVPRLFWWEGPDGSRVLTFYSLGVYGSSLTPPNDWPYPVWLALMQTNDNMGPQDTEYVKDLFKEVEEESPETEAVIGTLDDFYNELIRYPLDIPVIKKDLADTWIHGTGTYPKETSGLRELRSRMTETEKLLSMSSSLGFFEKMPLAANALSNAYEQCILFGEHTWGVDVKSTLRYQRLYEKKGFIKQKNQPGAQKAELSWDEQRNRFHCAVQDTQKAIDLLSANSALADHSEGKTLVFNGLGWERDGLPAFGYKIYNHTPETQQQNKDVFIDSFSGILENKWFKVQVNPEDGRISSLYEKEKKKEWVDSASPDGFGTYHYDIYGDEDITDFMKAYTYRFFDWSVNDLGRMNYPQQEHLTYRVRDFMTEEEQNHKSASLVMRGLSDPESVGKYGNAREIVTRITLYADEPFIDLRFELNGKEETPFVESGHFAFPLKLECAAVDVNKLGNVVSIESDIQKGANHALHCLENFVDVTNGDAGFAFLSKNIHLVSAGSKNILKHKPIYEDSQPS